MIAYFDCFSGVAGDMILGAMIDAGLPVSYLKRELSKLSLRGYSLRTKVERRGVLGGINFNVVVDDSHHHHHHTSLRSIKKMISSSRIAPNAKKTALAVFDRLGAAEAHVHRTKIEDVHFHEVGAVDSIVDIVGAAIGLDYFGIDEVYASPLPVARGFVKCQHGRIPLPAPATLEILKGVPLVRSAVKAELVTPTGAAILRTVVRSFGEDPVRCAKAVGYGHGDMQFKEQPNSLRFIVGEGARLLTIEANIDDMNPQIYEYLIERLIEHGAIDVTISPVLMKKRRCAQRVQVLCNEHDLEHLAEIILSETTTLGIRYYPVERKTLDREIKNVKTKFGTVRVKIARLGNDVYNSAPEYEDCKKIAQKKKVPLKMVINAALKTVKY